MAKLPPRPIGIDLGTTFSAVSCLSNAGVPQSLCNAQGQGVTPSVVLINPDRSIIVGSEALEARRTRPDHVAVNFKRDMGEKFFHEPVCGRQFAPEALAALVLKKLAQDAREAIEEITGVVITVPAYFGDHRRRATQDAGRIASLNVLDIINEPTAAALADAFRGYLAAGGDQDRLDVARIAARAPATTLVYDLGGGTFDVTVIRIDSNDFEVIATGGEVRLGGIDFDERLVHYIADEFVRRFGVDPRDVPEAEESLRARCEKAKIELSHHENVLFQYTYLGRQLDLPVHRQRFEQLTADLVSRTQISTEMLLEDALLNWEKIDNILLVGGSSRMPAVARMLERVSGKMPDMAIAPDQIVAHGAAIHAAMTSLRERASTPVGGGGRRLDSEGPIADDTEPAVTPTEDEHVRLQAIFEPPVVEAARKVAMTDVNAHGLGVIVRSSQEQRTVNSVIIPSNTPLPTSRVKVFGTEAPDQRRVRLRITEGETRDPRGCVQIGECVIKQLPKGLPRGAPVEVSFRYDSSGRIQVRAVELTSRISADVELHRNSGFEPSDLELLTDAVRELDVQ